MTPHTPRDQLAVFARLTRIEHAFLLALAVIAGALLTTKTLDWNQVALGVACVFFIEIGAFALNDLLDLKADKANKRKDRPLVTGQATPRQAMLIYKTSLPLGVLFAALANTNAFIIATAFAILSVAYSYSLKNLPAVGNAFIALAMAVPFVFGNYLVSSQTSLAALMLASIAFVFGFGREIAKSIQDVQGDKKAGRKTLPVVVGVEQSKYYASYFLMLGIFMAVIPFLQIPEFYYDPFYAVFWIVTDALVAYAIYLTLTLKNFKLVRNLTLAAQLTGLLGFLLGALF